MSEQIPPELMEMARAVADDIGLNCLWGMSDDFGLEHSEAASRIAAALLSVRNQERAQSGGASAIKFGDYLIVAHPEFPPHYWDGKKMVCVEFDAGPAIRGGEDGKG